MGNKEYKNFAALEVELLKQEIAILKQEKLLERERSERIHCGLE